MITFYQGSLESAPAEVRDRTVVVYEGWFSLSEEPLLRVGIIPLSLSEKKGWIWFSLLRPPSPREMRAAKRAVQSFWLVCDWAVIASVETPKAQRFAEFCGLKRIGEAEGLTLLEKAK